MSLYGEVQKEVIQAALLNDFGIDVEFRETTTICVEQPTGTGAAVDLLGQNSNPFTATVGLRVEPGPPGSGIQFRLDVGLGTIPVYVYKSVEEFRDTMTATVQETLRQGLFGWQVTDCVVTMTHSGYTSPGSTAADFRKLTPLVLMEALRQAGTIVCEPIHHFFLEIPTDTLNTIMSMLVRLRATPWPLEARGLSCQVEGTIPAALVHELQQRLPARTRGEGVLEWEFEGYQPIAEPFPVRRRTDQNPLNREEYLLHVSRRL